MSQTSQYHVNGFRASDCQSNGACRNNQGSKERLCCRDKWKSNTSERAGVDAVQIGARLAQALEVGVLPGPVGQIVVAPGFVIDRTGAAKAVWVEDENGESQALQKARCWSSMTLVSRASSG